MKGVKMTKKIATYCLGVAGLTLFTTVSIANYTAYIALKKVGIR
tara:strand:- start:326 stop:457 length:132 start_codon:yes stop_codon:yes gene_type:complete